jgi:arylsulfatase A-like enzyme
VHIPIQAPEPLVKKYEQKARDLGLDKQQAIIEGERFPFIRKRWLQDRIKRRVIQSNPGYAAMVENLDTNTGRLIDALDRAGELDNTIIVFTSDNGGLSSAELQPTSNLPLAEGKGWMYDGGVREPLIIAGPGIQAGVCDTPTTTPDFLPTFAELSGAAIPSGTVLDGVNIAPLLRGESIPERPIFWHYPHYSNQGGSPGCSVRLGDLKLIEFFEDGRLELYDLAADIGESRNLASSRPQDVQRLHGLLKQWRTSVEAQIPTPNPNFDAEWSEMLAQAEAELAAKQQK